MEVPEAGGSRAGGVEADRAVPEPAVLSAAPGAAGGAAEASAPGRAAGGANAAATRVDRAVPAGPSAEPSAEGTAAGAAPDGFAGPVPASPEEAAGAAAAEVVAEPDAESADGEAAARPEPGPPAFPLPVEVPESPVTGTEGFVYIVGAGPGDPGLLTCRGREVLERADVVVYDRLVHPALVALAPPDAERIFAGKAPGDHTLSQADINRTLVERASRGLQVVRLKGGDPFVFGRGGEECLALEATGIPYEVVPGVSAVVAAPAYAGIPVTHRDASSSFAVVTGHERAGRDAPAVDWSAYGRQPDTLVVLMGLAELAHIAEALIAAGRSPATPAAVIAEGTTPRQRVVVAELREVAERVRRAGLASPATLVVGEVVRLRERLGWFERRPLFGRRIVVTRTREQGSELAATLRRLGAEPVELPVLQITVNPSPRDLEWVVTHIATFWWVCFTSAHAIAPFFAALRARRLDARALAGTRLACVGPATARELEKWGLVPDLVPERATAADLAEALRAEAYPGQKVLYVCGQPTSGVLVTRLQRAGYEVHQAIVYEAGPDPGAAAAAERLLAEGADAVTFASSATVGYFLDATGDAGRRLCERAKVVCIGPVTARAAETLGLRVDAVAREASMAGMTAALLELWGEEPDAGVG